MWLLCVLLLTQHALPSADRPSIPRISLSVMQSRDLGKSAREKQKLLDAAENVGFFILTDHGLGDPVMERVWQVTSDFFDSSEENKRTVQMTREYIFGYNAREYLSNSEQCDSECPSNQSLDAKVDRKETFQVWIGSEARPERAANVRWPAKPVGMEEVWTQYYRRCETLSLKLLRILAGLVGIPFESELQPMFSDHWSALRALNYDGIEGSSNLTVRCSAHSDWGTLTLLRQSNTGCGNTDGHCATVLQIEECDLTTDTHCRWITVDAAEQDFIVNIGDVLSLMTNKRLRSVRHRVIQTSQDVSTLNQRRLSMAFFQLPSAEARIRPVGRYCPSDRECDTVLFSEYLSAKQRASVGTSSEQTLSK